jgi:hypothetical protein
MHEAQEGVLTFCEFTENNCRKISIVHLLERVNEELKHIKREVGLFTFHLSITPLAGLVHKQINFWLIVVLDFFGPRAWL